MNTVNKIKRKIKRRSKQFSFITNYFLNKYQKVIWLIGNRRSGTTWVSNLINHNKIYREMFEPFHPQYIDNMKFLQVHQYRRVEESDEQLKKAASDIFSGKFTHPRVDLSGPSYFFKGLLIKDIFANLFSCWAYHNFPHLKIILLIRNPFSVALSTYKKKNGSKILIR